MLAILELFAIGWAVAKRKGRTDNGFPFELGVFIFDLGQTITSAVDVYMTQQLSAKVTRMVQSIDLSGDTWCLSGEDICRRGSWEIQGEGSTASGAVDHGCVWPFTCLLCVVTCVIMLRSRGQL